MIDEADMTARFGAVVSRHRVATRTRWQNAAWALAAAVPTGSLALWAVSAVGDGGPTGAKRALGIVFGLALEALYVALTQALRAVRGGPGEYFEVRERGFVHGSRRGARGWAWERVVSVTIPGDLKTHAVAQRLGNDYRCTLALDDGERLRIDGHTTAASDLARTVLRTCPDAARLAGDEWQRKAGGWLLGGAAAFVAVAVAIVTYIGNHPDTDAAPGISDGMFMVFCLSLPVCAAGAIACVALFVRNYRLYHRR